MSIHVAKTSCIQLLLIDWSILLCICASRSICQDHGTAPHKGSVHVWSTLSADLLKFEVGHSWVAPWLCSFAVWQEEDGAQRVEASSSVHPVWGGGGGLHVGGGWGGGREGAFNLTSVKDTSCHRFTYHYLRPATGTASTASYPTSTWNSNVLQLHVIALIKHRSSVNTKFVREHFCTAS